MKVHNEIIKQPLIDNLSEVILVLSKTLKNLNNKELA